MLLHSFLAAVATLLAHGAVEEDMEQCTKDTWGMAGEGYSKPFAKVNPKDFACTFQEHDISKIPFFAVNWYNTSEDFDRDWKGVDMNPKRHWEYQRSPFQAFRSGTLSPWDKKTNGPPFQKRDVALSSCEIPQDDGSFYRVQRVGPLVSTGGYDYWQFGWRDVWDFSEVLKLHPEGVMLTTSFSAGVLANGTAMGFPPIHIHHIHIGPVDTSSTGLRRGVGVKVKEQSYPVLGVEQHGDYECKEVDGGTDCLFERVADGYAKLLTTPLGLEGELNDVRAFHSEPMTWWYQIVVRYSPRTPTLRPLSQTFFLGPGPKATNQLATLMVFPTPTAVGSFYWYTGRMGKSGVLVRNKIHSHNSMFHKAFWFHATPEQLGLQESRFRLGGNPRLCQTGLYFWHCLPQPLQKTGFATFEDFQKHLMLQLAASAAKHDAGCSFLANGRCRSQRPTLICQANSSFQDVRDPRSGKTFRYDRRGPTCCRPWTFSPSDVYTVVGFMNKAERPPGPWHPDNIPEELPMHLHWVMSWDAQDGSSHYVNQVGSVSNDLHTKGARYDPNDRVEFVDLGGWNTTVTYMRKPEEPEAEGDVTDFMTVSQSVQRRGSGRIEAFARFAGASASVAMLWFAGRRWRKDCPAAAHCVRLWVPRFPSLRVKYVQHSI